MYIFANFCFMIHCIIGYTNSRNRESEKAKKKKLIFSFQYLSFLAGHMWQCIWKQICGIYYTCICSCIYIWSLVLVCLRVFSPMPPLHNLVGRSEWSNISHVTVVKKCAYTTWQNKIRRKKLRLFFAMWPVRLHRTSLGTVEGSYSFWNGGCKCKLLHVNAYVDSCRMQASLYEAF
jgi:hypothetical protein